MQTHIKILSTVNGIKFQCKLVLGSDGRLRLPQVELRSPKFIRGVMDLGLDWCIEDAGERVFARYFDVGQAEFDYLFALMIAPERRLPLIVVSDLNGDTIAGDIHEKISSNVCGLAHTCRLNQEAAWKLTQKVGKEWSCYNGAIRLFWPFRLGDDDFRTHPLWTFDRIVCRSSNQIEARDQFVKQITRRLFEAPTFVADDPSFAWFEAEKTRRANDAARASANESGDFKALAEHHAADNDRLQADLDAMARANEVLQQKVEAFEIALRSKRVTEVDSTIEAPPESLADAVQTARAELSDAVVFSEQIVEQTATLNPAAGPPEKVLRYLQTLGQLSRILNTGKPLGRSVPIWLRENGVDCSIESESTKNNKISKKQRMSNINGEDAYCEYHANRRMGWLLTCVFEFISHCLAALLVSVWGTSEDTSVEGRLCLLETTRARYIGDPGELLASDRLGGTSQASYLLHASISLDR